MDTRPGASRAQDDRITGLRANPSVRAWLSASRGWRATSRVLSLELGLGSAPASGACRDKGGTYGKDTMLRIVPGPQERLHHGGGGGHSESRAEDICLSNYVPFFLAQVGLSWWNPAETAWIYRKT